MRLVAVLALLCLQINLSAQVPEFKWGKIPEEDLSMTVYEADPEAGAVVLGTLGELKFDFSDGSTRYRFERHKRIKIINRSGFDQGDIEFYYYSYSNQEKLENLKVLVFTPDGEKIQVNKSNVFKEEDSNHWTTVKIAVPNLEPGAIIEYRYTILSERIVTLPTWEFQEDIPIRYSELRLEVPEWFDYVYLQEGQNLDINETDRVERSMTIPRYSENAYGDRQDRGYQKVFANLNVRRMVVLDSPALRPEPFVTTMDDYYSQVRFQLRSIQYPDSQLIPVLTNWATVCKELLTSSDFGDQINDEKHTKAAWRQVQAVFSEEDEPLDKMHAIYDHLVGRMTWDGYYGIFVDKDLDDLYESRTASAGELNLLLIALLNRAGVQAFPLLTSTRGHGKMYEQYPFVNQFNHVLAVAIVGDEPVLMDLGNAARPAGLLAVHSLNKRALLVDVVNPVWLDIPAQPSKEVYYSVMNVDQDGAISGTMKTSEEGYAALSYRGVLKDQPLESIWKDQFGDQFPDCVINSIAVSGEKEVYEKLKQEFEFHLPQAAQVAGDFIYVNPVIYSDFLENPFTLEERAYPVDIPYPIEEKYIYNLAIPEGYVVEEKPEPTRIVMDGNGGVFQYNISERNGNVQVIVEIKVQQLYYSADQYSIIKGFFDILAEKMSEPVVLKKS